MHYSFISIEGNIGAGKSSLTEKLAKKLKCDTAWETFKNNPFLKDFYEGKTNKNFQLETSMFFDRIEALNQKKDKKNLIADFWIEKSLVFSSINLDDKEQALFRKIYDYTTKPSHLPSLVIYLDASIQYLKKNISKRNRAIEQKIDTNYLEKLNSAYRNFLYNRAHRMPILIINVEEFDFINSQNDFETIINKLETKMLPGIHKLEK